MARYGRRHSHPSANYVLITKPIVSQAANAQAEQAAVTATAFDAVVAIKPRAETVVVTSAANNVTRPINAGTVTASTVAFDATVKVGAQAEQIAVTSASNAPTAANKPNAEQVAVTASAPDAIGSTSPPAGWVVVSQTNGTGNKSAGTAATASITANVGDVLIAFCVSDDISAADAIGTTAVTDASNTWTRKASNQAQTAATAVAQAVFTTVVSATMTNTTVTFTPSASAAAKNFMVMRCASGGSEIVRGTTVTGSGSTSPFASLTHTGPTNGDLVLGFWAGEGPTADTFTDDTDTTNGSWSTSTNDFGTSGATGSGNVHGQVQYKVVSATGSQTWDTSGTAVDYRNLVIALAGGTALADAELVSATSTAFDATVAVKPIAGAVVATSVAENVQRPIPAGTVTATVTANGVTEPGEAGQVAVTATAFNVMRPIPAGTVTATATANDGKAAIKANAETVTVSVSAFNVMRPIPAGQAAETVTAFDASVAIKPSAGTVVASTVALDTTVSTQRRADAGLVTVTVTAYDTGAVNSVTAFDLTPPVAAVAVFRPTIVISDSIGVTSAVVTTNSPTAANKPVMGVVGVAAAAFSPKVRIGGLAGHVAVTATVDLAFFDTNVPAGTFVVMPEDRTNQVEAENRTKLVSVT